MLLGGALAWEQRRFTPAGASDSRKTIGSILRDIGGRDPRLGTTGTGLVPPYFALRNVDAWGLNDPPGRSDRGGPPAPPLAVASDAIMFHASYTPRAAPPAPGTEWDRMVAVLHRFAACRGYTLAAAFAPDPTQSHYYFVKDTWSGAARFRRAVAQQPYSWPGTTTAAMELSPFDRFRPACGPVERSAMSTENVSGSLGAGAARAAPPRSNRRAQLLQ